MTAMISENALTILKKRYLTNGETPEGMFRRVAGGNGDYFRLMSELKFLPNSPTLFNAGTGNGCTLSACFKFDVADNMLDTPDGIMPTRLKAVAVAKAGGGVGYYLGNIRSKGSLIKSVHRKACGPVAVLRDYHGVRQLVTQGGKRDLAQMGILPCWHEDVWEFIHCKDEDPQGLSSFNISVSWTDEWLTRAFSDPESTQAKSWQEQVESAWKTGDPGVYFFDAAERANPTPWIGKLTGTNPCGEVPLLNDEPCNLGSLNLAVFVNLNRGEVEWESLREAARQATFFLDNILDRNTFPHPDIDAAARRTRKLGLGVMGWADMLALLGIHYDTEEAVHLGGRVMQAIDEAALEASMELAAAKGPYPGYDEAKAVGPCCRNATRTCIAPTGTISIIAGTSSGIEPHFALEWERTTNEGIKLRERVPVMDSLNGFVPRTAGEIAVEWHVRHQAIFQKHTDLAVSKTINLPNSATKEDVGKAYRLMWESGCKGGTVYRDGCRSEQVLVAAKKTSVYTTEVPVQRTELPTTRQSETHKFRAGDTKGFLTVGYFADGKPAEIFLRVSKIGSTVSGMLDTWAIAFSIALQNGVPLQSLCEHHIGTRFEPFGLTGNTQIPVCSSIPDYVCRWLQHRFASEGKSRDVAGSVRSGQLCPDCGGELLFQSGCLMCPQTGCGWTKCG